MKRLLTVLVLLMVLGTGLFAIDLGNFPVGSWLDHNYDAVWTFTSDTIVLSLTSGERVFDFKDKMDRFTVQPGGNGIELSFSCDETGRKYKFAKDLNLTDTKVKMFIQRDDGVEYQVVMEKLDL